MSTVAGGGIQITGLKNCHISKEKAPTPATSQPLHRKKARTTGVKWTSPTQPFGQAVSPISTIRQTPHANAAKRLCGPNSSGA
jgi:hypothetical protein